MNNTHTDVIAQRHYEAYFGALAALPTHDDVLSIEQLSHGLRGPCEWEVLLATGGPAARVRVLVLDNHDIVDAVFEYQDWGLPWTAPSSQSHGVLTDWAHTFYLACPFCEVE